MVKYKKFPMNAYLP